MVGRIFGVGSEKPVHGRGGSHRVRRPPTHRGYHYRTGSDRGPRDGAFNILFVLCLLGHYGPSFVFKIHHPDYSHGASYYIALLPPTIAWVGTVTLEGGRA